MKSRQYAFILLLLTSVFSIRVFAQLIQVFHSVEFLPAFDRWHSGSLPYGWLLVAQALILAICLRIVWGAFNETIAFSQKKGRILFALGIMYLLAMSTRLIVGLTIAPNHFWLGATLPSVFHLVLASFVLLYGLLHCNAPQSLTPKHRK